MHYENTLAFAQNLDAHDPLRAYREQFVFPQHKGQPVLYFCGNSLGLQPKTVRQALLAELDHWAEYGVEGHFRGELPWMHYHKFLTAQTARLVGALPHEVVVMNTLTVNLHLMMVSFYRPAPGRYKIIMEAGAFPSDQYAVESQVRWHGFEPGDAIVEVAIASAVDAIHAGIGGEFFGTCEHHAAVAGAAQILGRIEGEGRQLADSAGCEAVAGRADGLTGVFDQPHPALLADRLQPLGIHHQSE